MTQTNPTDQELKSPKWVVQWFVAVIEISNLFGIWCL